MITSNRSMRLDHFLSQQYPTISRSFLAKQIINGKVKINGVSVTKAGYRIALHDTIDIDYDFTQRVPKPDFTIPIIYEDDDCIVINKPVGVLTHSKGTMNEEATVATWLAPRIDLAPGNRSGIVHRLDRGTSGVMICAKHAASQVWLQKQFSNRKVKKIYIAIVTGSLKQPRAIIDMPIERNPKIPSSFRVGSKGKPALTMYEVLVAHPHHSLVLLQPTTGRTHQLRVHLSHIGHPIVGDTVYGGEVASRLMLHAKSLEITLLSRERKVFSARQPREFNVFMGMHT